MIKKPGATMAKPSGVGIFLAALLLSGCAGGPGGSIYVPAGSPESKAPPSPDAETASEPSDTAEEPSSGTSENPSAPEEERPQPTHRTASEALSPAAASLVRSADDLLAEGNTTAAISQLERAQRISPRSGKVYLKLARAYALSDRLGQAEQFALKGLSLAGSNTALQRTGWSLLARIRREAGNVAGAEQAESRAAAL